MAGAAAQSGRCYRPHAHQEDTRLTKYKPYTVSSSQDTAKLNLFTLPHRSRAPKMSLSRQQLHHRQNSKPSRTSCRAAVYETLVAGNTVTAPAFKQPRGLVHFLGGAFAGAAPQLAYQYLIKWIADAGYTVVATPYAVTFRHLDCAARVQQDFMSSVDVMRQTNQAWMVPRGLPVHGIGHSNGALLHLLIGSQGRSENASNVIISYNNKQVKEAIPIPLDGLQTLVQNARSSPWQASLPTTEALLEGAVAISAAIQGILDRQTATALKPALDQIGSVFDEVGEGLTDFIPAPAESRQIIASSYSVPQTLLLRFADDGIDETNLIEPVLQRSNGAGATVLTLPGSHVTPCGGDSTWQVGRVFTPADAVALAAKAVLQTDLRRTARKVVEWLDSNS